MVKPTATSTLIERFVYYKTIGKDKKAQMLEDLFEYLEDCFELDNEATHY